jgi:hypothetical protein
MLVQIPQTTAQIEEGVPIFLTGEVIAIGTSSNDHLQGFLYIHFPLQEYGLDGYSTYDEFETVDIINGSWTSNTQYPNHYALELQYHVDDHAIETVSVTPNAPEDVEPGDTVFIDITTLWPLSTSPGFAILDSTGADLLKHNSTLNYPNILNIIVACEESSTLGQYEQTEFSFEKSRRIYPTSIVVESTVPILIDSYDLVFTGATKIFYIFHIGTISNHPANLHDGIISLRIPLDEPIENISVTLWQGIIEPIEGCVHRDHLPSFYIDSDGNTWPGNGVHVENEVYPRMDYPSGTVWDLRDNYNNYYPPAPIHSTIPITIEEFMLLFFACSIVFFFTIFIPSIRKKKKIITEVEPVLLKGTGEPIFYDSVKFSSGLISPPVEYTGKTSTFSDREIETLAEKSTTAKKIINPETKIVVLECGECGAPVSSEIIQRHTILEEPFFICESCNSFNLITSNGYVVENQEEDPLGSEPESVIGHEFSLGANDE